MYGTPPLNTLEAHKCAMLISNEIFNGAPWISSDFTDISLGFVKAEAKDSFRVGKYIFQNRQVSFE
jgi:hypothetical protein